MDFNEFSTADTFTFNLIRPDTGEKLDSEIEVFSPFSDEYQKSLYSASQQKPKHDLYSVLIKSWSNVEYQKKQLECNEDNKAMLLKEHPWICDQVDAAVSNRGNFIKG